MEKYMKLAIIEAKKAYKKGDVPIGCVIVLGNKVISKAHNTREYDNVSINHAEMNAIRKACKRLKGWRLNECEIYVTKQPCPMCMSAIEQSRIKKVYYGTENDEKRVNYNVEMFGKLLGDECDEIITNFFKERRVKI